MARPSSRSRAPLSLEASLDEENREVLAALDWQRPRSPALRTENRNNTPPPPIRSMLDVDSPTPRHGSIAGIGVGITSPKQLPPKESKLDPSDPSTWTRPASISKPTSPDLTHAELQNTRPRGGSDATPTTSSYVGLPRVQPGASRGFEQNYQFDLSSIPSSGSGSAKSPTDPKRQREGSGSGAMAAALSGDFSNFHVGRTLPTRKPHNSSDRSPSGQVRSPTSDSSSLLSPQSPPGQLVTAQGTVVDENAHRRLSNKSGSFSTVDDESEVDTTRVPIDKPTQEDAMESSDEEAQSSGSDDEARGRDRDRKSSVDKEPAEPDLASPDEPDSRIPSPEEERKPSVPHSQVIKSMLEPSISVTSPTGENLLQPGAGIKPRSSFDQRRMSNSATSGTDEDDDAIAKAKTLGLNISPLDTRVVDRHVRMIIRGDWVSFHKEAEAGNRNTRTYLACSDLSVEATYAMEWTVGTIMRDGDTLLAIYAIEDENAGSPSSTSSRHPEADREVLHQEGAKAGKDANDAMATLTRQTTNPEDDKVQSTFIPATEAESLTGSVDARKVGKKELERLKAIDDITQTFLRLVRKTTLQVRCMVEVIHCKSPKHLILGAVSQAPAEVSLRLTFDRLTNWIRLLQLSGLEDGAH